MEVCLKLDNIKLENRPYTEVSFYGIMSIRWNKTPSKRAVKYLRLPSSPREAFYLTKPLSK